MQYSFILSNVYNFFFVAFHATRDLCLYCLSLVYICNRHAAPDKSNKKKYAVLVTGTSTGIGNAIATVFLQKGYTVFAGVRSQADAKEWQAQRGVGEVIPVILDVCEQKQVEDAFKNISNWIGAEHGRRLFAVVNNAGIVDAMPLEHMPMEKVESVVETNFIGAVRVIKTFLPLLRQSNGRIINVASILAVAQIPLLSMYVASKTALEGLSDSLRTELMPQKVAVSLIEPGFVASAIYPKAEQVINVAGGFYDIFTGTEKDFIITMGEKYSSSPYCVALATSHAVESSFPKTRYVVGVDATAFWLTRKILPDFVWDGFIFYGLQFMNGYSYRNRKVDPSYTKAQISGR